MNASDRQLPAKPPIKVYTSLTEIDDNATQIDAEELRSPTLLICGSMRYAVEKLNLPVDLRETLEELLHDGRAAFRATDDEESKRHPYEHVPGFLKRREVPLRQDQVEILKKTNSRKDLEHVLQSLGFEIRFPV